MRKTRAIVCTTRKGPSQQLSWRRKKWPSTEAHALFWNSQIYGTQRRSVWVLRFYIVVPNSWLKTHLLRSHSHSIAVHIESQCYEYYGFKNPIVTGFPLKNAQRTIGLINYHRLEICPLVYNGLQKSCSFLCWLSWGFAVPWENWTHSSRSKMADFRRGIRDYGILVDWKMSFEGADIVEPFFLVSHTHPVMASYFTPSAHWDDEWGMISKHLARMTTAFWRLNTLLRCDILYDIVDPSFLTAEYLDVMRIQWY